MARIEAQPEALGAAGGSQSQLAARLAELAGRLEAAGASGAAAAGEPAAAQAISDGCASWSASLLMVADSVGGLATNLTAAGSAYRGTDASAIPAAKR